MDVRGDPSGPLADAIVARLLAHPAVVSLDGGPRGTVATLLPGRRVLGVRVAGAGHPVEISVALRLGERLPEVAAELRGIVRAIVGAVPVDITVTDVVTDAGTAPVPGTRPHSDPVKE